ncbi:MAG: redoxin family protein [Bacteroidota bacterium]
MKNKGKILLLLSTLFVLSTSLVNKDKGPKPLKVGKSAPMADLEMKNTDGTSATLKSSLGENGLLVIFSCNTCPFVVGSDKFAGWEVQYNDLNKMALEGKINTVLVNSNEAKREKDDSMDAMKLRAKDKAYEMAYLLDHDSKLANAFGAKTTPHVYLFNKDLKLVYMGAIDNSWDAQRKNDVNYLKNALTELAGNSKISVKSSDPRGCSIKRK